MHSGVIDAVQLSAGLRQQVVYGGRLGTNLIELGYADADQIARALAKLHNVPAALQRHLERHDPAVLSRVPRELAARALAVPVAYSMARGKRLVLCMRDPYNAAAIAAVEQSAGLPAIACVAAELLVYAVLDRFYKIPRPRRFLHAAHGHATPLPNSQTGSHPAIEIPAADAIAQFDDESFDIDFEDDTEMPSGLQLVDLDDQGVVRDLSQYSVNATTGISGVPSESGTTDLGALSARALDSITNSIISSAAAIEGSAVATFAQQSVDKIVDNALVAAPNNTNAGADLSQHQEPVPSCQPPESSPSRLPREPALSFGQARAAIRAAENGSDVSNAVIDFMRGAFHGGLVLLVKDGLALGACGFGGLFDDQSVESIVIPLSVPSMFRRARDDKSMYRGAPPEDGRQLQDRFFKLFATDQPPIEVVLAPVSVRERVVCLYYAHGTPSGPLERLDDDAAVALGELGAVAAEAFIRLIRQAKQGSPSKTT